MQCYWRKNMNILIDEQDQFKKIATRLVDNNILKLNAQESNAIVELMNQCFLYGLEFGLNNEVSVEL